MKQIFLASIIAGIINAILSVWMAGGVGKILALGIKAFVLGAIITFVAIALAKSFSKEQ